MQDLCLPLNTEKDAKMPASQGIRVLQIKVTTRYPFTDARLAKRKKTKLN